jgi:TatA/E family protein of Tat protein translocase
MGVVELLIVLVIVVVLFGAVKLPKLARSIGRAPTEFKRGQSEDDPPEHPLPPA